MICRGCSKEFEPRSAFVKYCGKCPQSVYRRRIADMKRKAQQKNVPFDLDVDYLVQLIEEADGKCTLTGIPFYEGEYSGRHPYTLSVDRIIPNKGYTKGNIRLVCFHINAAINEYGLEAFERLVKAYQENNIG